MTSLVNLNTIKISDLKMAGAGMAVGKAFTGLTGMKVAKVSVMKTNIESSCYWQTRN